MAKAGPRGPYKKSPKETRGQYKGESRICGLFWKYHRMEEIITLTPQELEVKLEKFYDDYQARQMALNFYWWYPEFPHEKRR